MFCCSSSFRISHCRESSLQVSLQEKMSAYPRHNFLSLNSRYDITQSGTGSIVQYQSDVCSKCVPSKLLSNNSLSLMIGLLLLFEHTYWLILTTDYKAGYQNSWASSSNSSCVFNSPYSESDGSCGFGITYGGEESITQVSPDELVTHYKPQEEALLSEALLLKTSFALVR